jgi:hypothetical protein
MTYKLFLMISNRGARARRAGAGSAFDIAIKNGGPVSSIARLDGRICASVVLGPGV